MFMVLVESERVRWTTQHMQRRGRFTGRAVHRAHRARRSMTHVRARTMQRIRKRTEWSQQDANAVGRWRVQYWGDTQNEFPWVRVYNIDRGHPISLRSSAPLNTQMLLRTPLDMKFRLLYSIYFIELMNNCKI
jgi:hypothetical protein